MILGLVFQDTFYSIYKMGAYFCVICWSGHHNDGQSLVVQVVWLALMVEQAIGIAKHSYPCVTMVTELGPNSKVGIK